MSGSKGGEREGERKSRGKMTDAVEKEVGGRSGVETSGESVSWRV